MMAANGRAGNAVLKRVAALNRSGNLARPLRYSEVRGSLDAVGEVAALRILAELEGAEADDPAAFVCEAAAAVGATPRKVTGHRASTGQDATMEKRVRVLNGSGKLVEPIVYERVQEPLCSLGVGQAMTILMALEDSADSVLDPTEYIREAVRGAGGVVAESDHEGEEPEEDAALPQPRTPIQPQQPPAEGPRGFVKREAAAAAPRRGDGVKRELMGAKAEGLTEVERIERHLAWLTKNGKVTEPIIADKVLPALDCIGFRQAMRVLKRLEESPGVSDPNEFILDLVGRSGWIWAKPDVIDDDEKVAKRVAWLNQFGGLQKVIDWAEVADTLDGLRVPHAMVVLRELEVNSATVKDPTLFITQAVSDAGEDEVQAPVQGDKDSPVFQRLAWLNEHGNLAAAIDFDEVGLDLGRIKEKDAMQILQEIENKGAGVRDPTGYVKFKLKAKIAMCGASLEEEDDDETKISKRVEWLNDYGGLLQDIDYNRVASHLGRAGIEHAMTVLKELEDKRMGVPNPTSFILSAVASPVAFGGSASSGRSGRPHRAASRAGGAGGGAAANAANAGLATLSSLVELLSRRSKRPVKLGEVAGALDTLGADAERVLQDMQEKGLGLDDPVAYIRAKADRKASALAEAAGQGDDDVSKLTKRVLWLNKFGGLAKPIKPSEVVGAFYCLGVQQSMSILGGLQERGASVPDPTKYLKAQIRHANGVAVAGPGWAKEEVGAEEDDAEEEEAGEDGEALAAEAAALAEEYDEDACTCGTAWQADSRFCKRCGAKRPQASVAWDAPGADDDFLGEAAALAEAYDEEEDPQPKRRKTTKPETMRVVGAITGLKRLVPPQAEAERKRGPGVTQADKGEAFEEDGEEGAQVAPAPPTAAPTGMLISPQEKLVQVRNLAIKCGLTLDELCLKSLTRLPFYKVKDMMDDVLLGGRDRKGVKNPSRYLTLGVQRMSCGLGVEQGIAMELAVSIGVVLNNDALDELASVPRKEAHSIIRTLAKDDEARKNPMAFIAGEVERLRTTFEARPFPGGAH